MVSKSLAVILPLHYLRPAKKWPQKLRQINSCMGLSEDRIPLNLMMDHHFPMLQSCHIYTGVVHFKTHRRFPALCKLMAKCLPARHVSAAKKKGYLAKKQTSSCMLYTGNKRNMRGATRDNRGFNPLHLFTQHCANKNFAVSPNI